MQFFLIFQGGEICVHQAGMQQLLQQWILQIPRYTLVSSAIKICLELWIKIQALKSEYLNKEW